jgi:diguanylate cyclase (GGDEF)-like protein
MQNAIARTAATLRQRTDLLRRLWRGPIIDEPLAGRVRAEQIVAVVRLTPFMMIANAVNMIIVIVTFWASGSRPFLVAWSIALAIAIGLAMRGWHLARRRPAARPRSDRTIARATQQAAFLGFIWGVFPVALFPDADGTHQLLCAVMATGMVSGGGFALSSVPRAALAYVGLNALGCMTALALWGDPVAPAIAALLVIYAATVTISVVGHAQLFVDRLLHQFTSERHSDAVGLLLRDFEESASDWLWEVDAMGRLQRVTPRLAGVLERDIEILRGADFIDILSAAEMPGQDQVSEPALARPADIARHFLERTPFRDLVLTVQIGGEQRWWSLTAKPVHDDSGALAGFRGAGRDLTTAKRAEARIYHMAHYDGLTELPNRALLRANLARTLERVKRRGGSAALLYLDLDRFKVVNDTLGHPTGDLLLTLVTRRLQTFADEFDTLARLGGDEFAILLPTGDPAHVMEFARRLIKATSAIYDLDGIQFVVGTSVGIALAPADGDDPEALLKSADLALYRAKAEGRGTFRFFEPEMDGAARARRDMEVDLRRALIDGQLHIHFQPILDLATETISGFEALLRWHHPERGWILPGEFIPIAEEAGLITTIGEWVLRRACEEASRWSQPVRVAVNLSAIQLRSATLVHAVIGALAASGIAPDRLELEITESVLIEDTELAIATLHQLHGLGVRLALDDFGTGYSSLGCLSLFPFDKVKIDKSVVQDMAARPDCLAIVRAIITLAACLGITTTAEGVETEEQLARLCQEGCTEGQGYLVSRPRPTEEVAAMLAQTTVRAVA